MGMFKQMKDMKGMVHDAPNQIAQAQELAKNAQAMSAAYQAQAAQQIAAINARNAAAAPVIGEATGPDFEPVNGVSLELYAQISKGIAAAGNDQSQGPLLAAAQGISPSDWDAATTAWNDRMGTNPAVTQQFTTIYRAV